jgi:hypothetical protein
MWRTILKLSRIKTAGLSELLARRGTCDLTAFKIDCGFSGLYDAWENA